MVDVQNRFINKITPVIKKISNNQGPYVEKALENLYPIHPYTSFLATYLAEIIGSTERSIFGFLHDKDVDHGFRSFINSFEVDERYFLTSDYLWDFFWEDFEKSEDPKIGSAIQKYNVFKDVVGAEGEEYLVIFKLILLLNILVKMVQFKGESPAIPSEENINNAFIGSIYEDKVTDVLKFIDGHGVINKSPDNIFELTSSALPSNKIATERKKLENTKLIDVLNSKQKKDIEEAITKKVNRHTEVTLFNGNIPENNLKATLNKDDSDIPFLHMYLFLCKDIKEFNTIKNIIRSLSKELLKNKIMVISKAFFEDNVFNRYLDYKATSIVAKQFDQVEDYNRNLHNAEMLVDDWVNDIKNKYIVYYLNGKNDELEFPDFIKRVNEKLSKSIFDKGFENLKNSRKYILWEKKKSSPAIIEAYLFSKSFTQLDKTLSGENNQTTVILKDQSGNQIVNSNNLEFSDNIPDNHPLKLLQEKVDEKMNKAQERGSFSLGRVLNNLIEPPYGVYKNKIYYAALSFTLRKYVSKLYDFDGSALDESKMKHKIGVLFDYFEGNTKKEQDLKVRFGSEYEKKLIYLLIDIFDLHMEDKDQSIDSVRWAIHTQWTKPNKIPIWLLNYSDEINPNLKKAINSLFKIVKPIDRDIPDSDIQECYVDLEPVNVDFRLLLKDSYESLYKNLILESFEKVRKDMRDSIPTIIEFIINEMPEEGYWDKTIVTDNIYSWIINNQTPGTESGVSKEPVDEPEGTESGVSKEPADEPEGTDGAEGNFNTSIIVNKVKEADANKLKNILIKALEENVEIRLIFDKYLEE